VAENEWANIPPKTLRGTWEAIVSTEEFERGLAILSQRNRKPVPKKKHFYLLQGLIYMEMPDGELIKLNCGRPNTGRTQNGVAYYCIPSSPVNFPCHQIDPQIPTHLQSIQVSPDAIPQIRRAYQSDVSSYTSAHTSEQQSLEGALVRVKDKELNLWRAFTEHGMRAEMFEKLAREYQDEQDRITFALKAIQQENRETIANLDAALAVIAEIGARYERQDVERRRDILRQVVERVVIDAGGNVLRLELRHPFVYLHELAGDNGNRGQVQRNRKRGAGKQTSSLNGTGCSFHLGFGDPGRTRTYNQLIKSQLLCH
jgi:hypothetical protein